MFSKTDSADSQLETSMWLSPAANGATRVDFIQKVKQTGKMCLGGGVAVIKAPGSKL